MLDKHLQWRHIDWKFWISKQSKEYIKSWAGFVKVQINQSQGPLVELAGAAVQS